MTNLIIALLAYLTDRKFGKFDFMKHPVVVITELIRFFEHKYYKNSVLRGLFLVMFVLSIVSGLIIALNIYLDLFVPLVINIIITAFIASMFISHKALRDAMQNILTTDNKEEALSLLVAHNIKNISQSKLYKTAIEVYAKRLSRDVVAPIFYLVLFGLPGIVIYKAISTLDSIVGYNDSKYEKFGKVSAVLDDLLNYIPAQITAILIMLLAKQKNPLAFYKAGVKHNSRNARHPISAMALALQLDLDKDTIQATDLQKAINLV